MCLGIRAEQAEPGREGASQPASGPGSLRPRLVGAAAALLVAGFAAAALLAPSTPAPGVVEKTPAAVVPTVTPPAAGAVEQTSLGLDDGVPFAKKQSNCHHDL